MSEKLGWIEKVGRLVVLPQQVDKLEKKVDEIQTTLATCVKDDELKEALKSHRETHDEKLDLVIDLLKRNNSGGQ